MARKSATADTSSDVTPVVDELPLEEAGAPAQVPVNSAAPAAPVEQAPIEQATEQAPAAEAPQQTPPAAAPAVVFSSAPLYAGLGVFGQRLETEAERVVAEALNSIDAKFHSPELVAKVQEATHKLAIASVGRIGATPDEIQKLAEMRDEAIAVIQSFEGHATHGLEEVIVKGIHRMYAQVQDLASGHLSDVVKHLSFLERLPMAGAIVSAVRHLLAA